MTLFARTIVGVAALATFVGWSAPAASAAPTDVSVTVLLLRGNAVNVAIHNNSGTEVLCSVGASRHEVASDKSDFVYLEDHPTLAPTDYSNRYFGTPNGTYWVQWRCTRQDNSEAWGTFDIANPTAGSVKIIMPIDRVCFGSACIPS